MHAKCRGGTHVSCLGEGAIQQQLRRGVADRPMRRRPDLSVAQHARKAKVRHLGREAVRLGPVPLQEHIATREVTVQNVLVVQVVDRLGNLSGNR